MIIGIFRATIQSLQKIPVLCRVVQCNFIKYGFANIYILNPFDRFAIMTLLSDFPVGVWSELVYPGVELNPNKEEDMES